MEFFEFTNIAQSLSALISNDPYYTYYWACLIVGGVAFLALYSLEAVALNSIAKNNGFKHRWMAFVPLLNTYYIGVLAEKNKTFNAKTKYFSLALAILETIGVALSIAYSVAVIELFNTSYIKAVPEPFYNTAGEFVGSLFTGKYEVENLPASLNWAWWVFNNVNNYFLSIIDLISIVLSVFVLSAFFRTYSPRNYMIFTIFSVIFPVKAIFMICIKNNKAVNYVDYMREMQKRQYDAYQQYMRNNGGYNNGGYNGGYNGAGQGQASKPEDPFGGLGEQSGRTSTPSDDDPFEDLK
ncbi:MAG: hypothetical protein ACI4MC_01370 [Candidatus Coproplasma sp.]